jgi:uncharacterized protein (DUF2164 family)
MAKVKRSWDMIPEEKRQRYVEEIIGFFQKERDEKIGMIAGEEILDFFQEKMGGEIYNKGVDDAKKLLGQRFGDLEMDLDLLCK